MILSLTICFLYPMIALLSVFGFMLLSFELHDVLFWCHEIIPFSINLVPIFRPIFNFLIAWIKFMWNVVETCTFIAFNILSFTITTFSVGVPFVMKPLRLSVSFLRWMCSELWRGVYMTGNPILTLFSWIMLTCACLLCLDHIFTTGFYKNQQVQQVRLINEQQIFHGENDDDNENDDQVNENVENRLIEIRHRLLNRRLNPMVLNHNEENVQENQNDRRERNNEIRGDNLNQTGASLIERQLCIICVENVKNYAVFPCGHMHFCRVCVERLFRLRNNVKCPVCNISITEYRRIYV